MVAPKEYGDSMSVGGGDAGTRFFSLWAEIHDLGVAAAMLSWDQETYMPPGGAPARGEVLATLAAAQHQRLCASEFSDAVDALEDGSGDDPVLIAQAREARRGIDKARRVPEDLARALAAATSAALVVWRQAREDEDFAVFENALGEVVKLTRERAHCLCGAGRPYDALLDDYERGATTDRLSDMFADLRRELVPLLRAVGESGVDPDETPVLGRFPSDAQRALGTRVAGQMGFDFGAGRLDPTEHPFCSGMDRRDVRITWRWDEGDFRPALFGIMHETGHGLYEQGLPEQWRRTPLGSAASLGIHESQSRLWENLVGRSRAFWRWGASQVHEILNVAADVSGDDLWHAVNVVRPSLVRVEADEVSYNLHVIARFELEQALIEGDLGLADLPGAWDETYHYLLGLRPRRASEGVLQDIHWAMGAFGYFPTYTIGNLVAAQIHEAALSEIGSLEEAVSDGDFAPLSGWLREKVHSQGSRWLPDELVDRATGRPLESTAFVEHVKRVCADHYGVVRA